MRQDSERLLQTYLRRGIPGEAQVRIRIGSSALELKFNPYHDPENGRFTFAPGGGFFGGGGASGSWSLRAQPQGRDSASIIKTAGSREHRVAAIPPAKIEPASPPQVGQKPLSTIAQPTSAAPQLSSHVVSKNGYDFRIDTLSRTTEVTGTLMFNPAQARSRSAQAAAGGANRLPGDDGAHYIARRFNGPTDAFNHLAQDAHINRGAYRVLEDRWAAAMRSGEKVTVKITSLHTGKFLKTRLTSCKLYNEWCALRKDFSQPS